MAAASWALSSLITLAHSAAPPRIAVIGGGIGGAATCHYLARDIPGASTTVFERDRVGGRLWNLEHDGVKVELGGTFINKKLNPHMAELTDAVNAKTTPLLPSLMSQDAYIYNGTATPLKLRHGHLIGDGLKIMERYGLSMTRTLEVSQKFFTALQAMQDRLRSGDTFDNITSLLSWSGLGPYARVNATELLRPDKVSSEFLEQIISAFTNVIYTQGNSVNGFVVRQPVSILRTHASSHFLLPSLLAHPESPD